MEQKNPRGQGYHDNHGRREQKSGCRVDIRNEPSKSADIRHQKNSQPDFQVGDLFFRDIQVGQGLPPVVALAKEYTVSEGKMRDARLRWSSTAGEGRKPANVGRNDGLDAILMCSGELQNEGRNFLTSVGIKPLPCVPDIAVASVHFAKQECLESGEFR